MAAVVAFFRFIPAGAGNSVNPITKNMKPSVYPRWRGELKRAPFNAAADGGLSPLARGTHVNLFEAGCDDRFIPAGAGNSSGN